MTLWTNKQVERELKEVFNLDIPNGNGNIYHNGIQVGYADSFNGIRLSKKVIEPEALNDMCVWNPYEETNFEIDTPDQTPTEIIADSLTNSKYSKPYDKAIEIRKALRNVGLRITKIPG